MLRDRIEYAIFVLLSALVRWAPPPLTRAFASGIARAVFRFGGRSVRDTMDNLLVAYPELPLGERREIARASFVNFAWNAVDIPRTADWDEQDMAEHVTLNGLENLERARAKGRGVLILCLHLGNFELAIRAVNAAGLKATVLGRPLRNPLIYEKIRASRTSFGGQLLDRDNAAPQMLRLLHKNGVIGVLMDQYVSPSNGMFVPFFGVRASTSPGVAILALRTGAAVLAGYTWRVGLDHHSVQFLPELDVPVTGNRAKDIEVATAAYNEELEQIIRQHPGQWMWGHRRFRHSPDLVDPAYAKRTRRPSRR